MMTDYHTEEIGKTATGIAVFKWDTPSGVYGFCATYKSGEPFITVASGLTRDQQVAVVDELESYIIEHWQPSILKGTATDTDHSGPAGR